MASSDKKKKSTSSQPNTAALVTIPGSELDFYTNSNYLAYELPQYAAAQRQGKLGSDNIDDGISDKEEEKSGDEEEEKEEESGDEGDESDGSKSSNRPSLSDIEVISNEVVYDSANNPTAKIVFKIKNSSGVELKAVNVRVEKK
ncbi:hypothetical protein EBU71_19325 [bacterium]|nr:hypothetical protein [Candidatus Elulimicrobium humile]